MERDFLEPRTTRIYAEEIQNPKFKESKFQVSVKLREIRGLKKNPSSAVL